MGCPRVNLGLVRIYGALSCVKAPQSLLLELRRMCDIPSLTLTNEMNLRDFPVSPTRTRRHEPITSVAASNFGPPLRVLQLHLARSRPDGPAWLG